MTALLEATVGDAVDNRNPRPIASWAQLTLWADGGDRAKLSVHSPTWSPNTCLWSPTCAPGSLLGTRDSVVNQTGKMGNKQTVEERREIPGHDKCRDGNET